MSAVFLDTVGLLALFDVRDQWHVAAASAWSRVSVADTNFVTTPYILVECANAAARRPYRTAVAELKGSLTTARVLIYPSDDEWDTAWRHYARGDAGGASVVDHLSFLVMRRFGLTQAFTNDRHFVAAGFETLF